MRRDLASFDSLGAAGRHGDRRTYNPSRVKTLWGVTARDWPIGIPDSCDTAAYWSVHLVTPKAVCIAGCI